MNLYILHTHTYIHTNLYNKCTHTYTHLYSGMLLRKCSNTANWNVNTHEPCTANVDPFTTTSTTMGSSTTEENAFSSIPEREYWEGLTIEGVDYMPALIKTHVPLCCVAAQCVGETHADAPAYTRAQQTRVKFLRRRSCTLSRESEGMEEEEDGFNFHSPVPAFPLMV